MTKTTAKYWIEHLNLQAHPEGGYFKEVYRSDEQLDLKALPNRYNGGRNIATSIYYLLESGQVSHFHHLHSDETWVHITGDALTLHQFVPAVGYRKTILGKDLLSGQTPQHTIIRGTHFGAASNGSYTLAACFVAPGFDFQDFHFSEKELLLQEFPAHKPQIEELDRFFK